jgi:chlorobactene glucosyltransferase
MSHAFEIYLFLIASILVVLGSNAIVNILFGLWLGKVRPAPNPAGLPTVSLLIPMRNEAAIIGETLANLRSLSYPQLEILILDDQSSDGSGEIARQGAASDARVRILPGEQLPAGWLGKNWACWQLAEQAHGEFLLFSDADVRWQAGGIEQALALSQATNADLLSVWPTQQTVTWAERLTVPLIAQAVLAYLPIVFGVNLLPFGAFAAANGQCMLFRRAAYQQIGGHSVVRRAIVEDVTLARRIKSAGLRLRLADGHHWVNCRMYTGWESVRNGFAKNILAGHGGILPLLLSTLFHWAVFLLPWLFWLCTGDWRMGLLAGMGVLIRAVTATASKQRVLDAITLPLTVLIFTIIAAQSLWWRVLGKTQWKGRVIG